MLIKSGAKLVENISDILEEVKLQIHTGFFEPFQKHKVILESISYPDLSDLNPDEKKIYDILSMEPVHLDDLAFHADFPSHRCADVLLHLELKGLVSQLDGNHFIRTDMNKVNHG